MEILGGPLFGVGGAGESHGPAVTTIVFGCPAGQRVSRFDVQGYLDRRRPGGNKHGTPRNEKDKVVFLSGLYQEDYDQLLGHSKLSVDVDGATFGTENAFASVERREFANERLNRVFDAWYWIDLRRITEGFYDTALNEASDA